MRPVKRELAAAKNAVNVNGPSINKKARLSGSNKVVVDVNLPSDDWFDQMYGPLGVQQSSSCTNILSQNRRKKTKNKLKTPKKSKKTNSTPSKSDLIEIEVSDGEDMYQAFPLLSEQKEGKKEDDQVNEEKEKNEVKRIEKTNENNKKKKANDSFDDDNLDFVVLFESITDRTLKRGNSSEDEASDDDNCTINNINVKNSKIVDSSTSQIKNAVEESFGITSNCSTHLFEQIAQHVKKYPYEFEIFNKNIWTHFKENLQNDHTYVWKMRVRNILNEIIKQIFPNESVNLVAVGSTVNGCGAFNSDMDLCLCMPCEGEGYDTRRNYAINRLRKVMRKFMNRKSLIQDIQFIPAKVPILKIKFQRPYQKLEVDINVNNVPGIYNSYLIHYYSRIDDRFPALCLLVKHWAKKKGILDACSGFFNSYSLILMVLHFLQCGVAIPILPNLQFLYPDYFYYFRALDEMKLFLDLPKPIPEIQKNNLSVGELLIAFFHYFNNFDFEECAISVFRGCVYSRSELSRNTTRFKIFIEEPFDFKNTARCVTNEECFEEILLKFREAVETLKYSPNLKSLISS